ncbi:MAG: helix-turn-helix domain-containing protein [Chloroflexota bacterium]|nr:helix-turn-helix domain-containing protein [Chloroflexota bacterium]
MEYLTVSEVAERLKVTPLTVRRWIKSGELIGVQLGDRAGWRISEEDLEAFLEARRSGEGARKNLAA